MDYSLRRKLAIEFMHLGAGRVVILVAKSFFRPPSPPAGGRGDKRKELLANAIPGDRDLSLDLFTLTAGDYRRNSNATQLMDQSEEPKGTSKKSFIRVNQKT